MSVFGKDCSLRLGDEEAGGSESICSDISVSTQRALWICCVDVRAQGYLLLDSHFISRNILITVNYKMYTKVKNKWNYCSSSK